MKCFILFFLGTCVWAAPVPVHRPDAERAETGETILHVVLPGDAVNADGLPGDVNADLPEDTQNTDDLPEDNQNMEESPEATQNTDDLEDVEESDVGESDEAYPEVASDEEPVEGNENAIPEEEEFQDFVNDEVEPEDSDEELRDDAEIAEQLAEEFQADITSGSADETSMRGERNAKRRKGRLRGKQKASTLEGEGNIHKNEDDGEEVAPRTEEGDTTAYTEDEESVVSADDEQTAPQSTDEEPFWETGDQFDTDDRTPEAGDEGAEETDEEEEAVPHGDKDEEISENEDIVVDLAESKGEAIPRIPQAIPKVTDNIFRGTSVLTNYTKDTKDSTIQDKAKVAKAESKVKDSIDKTKATKTISAVRDFIFVKAKDSGSKLHNLRILLRRLKEQRLSRMQQK